MTIKLGHYQHFKGGMYKVIGMVKHSETLEDMVLYQSQKDQGLWVRPGKMFEEMVEVEGKKRPRFELQSD